MHHPFNSTFCRIQRFQKFPFLTLEVIRVFGVESQCFFDGFQGPLEIAVHEVGFGQGVEDMRVLLELSGAGRELQSFRRVKVGRRRSGIEPGEIVENRGVLRKEFQDLARISSALLTFPISRSTPPYRAARYGLSGFFFSSCSMNFDCTSKSQRRTFSSP